MAGWARHSGGLDSQTERDFSLLNDRPDRFRRTAVQSAFSMSSALRPFAALPGYGVGGLLVLLLYAIQSEIRFGPKARRMSTGPADRGSTLAVSLSSAIPMLGFVPAMRRESSSALL